MGKAEFSEIHKKMISAPGHQVEVHLFEPFLGELKPVIGKCVDYISPDEEEPEGIASITVKVPGFTCLFGLTEDVIKDIVLLDKK